LRIASGPFNCRVQSNVADIAPEFAQLYANHPLVPNDEFIDFHVAIEPGRGLRRWLRPQARFLVDGIEPFTPLPCAQALPMIEWGLNWCITAYSQHVLILHAAAVAYGNRAVIMPAPPGSGKSTLCAALANRGWRLLSDELTIIRLDTGEISGLARPVNLKNKSIDVMRNFAPGTFLTAPVHDTTKGTVALMAPSAESVRDVGQAAKPYWMILPRYKAGVPTSLMPMQTGAAFLQIADNAMNYHVLGIKGFEAVGQLVDRCQHFSFEYSQLDEAIAQFDLLAAKD
jgi:HprK-related kinase A